MPIVKVGGVNREVRALRINNHSAPIRDKGLFREGVLLGVDLAALETSGGVRLSQIRPLPHPRVRGVRGKTPGGKAGKDPLSFIFCASLAFSCL